MEVTREIVLPAPREEVWAALTEAERLEEWFANEVEFDLERLLQILVEDKRNNPSRYALVIASEGAVWKGQAEG